MRPGFLALAVAVLSAGCLGTAGEMPDEADAGLAQPEADAGLRDVDAGEGDAGLTGADDAGAEADAGSDAGVEVDDAGTPPPDAGPGLVPVVVLVGKQGRRAISCDDGQSWTHDVSFDDALPEAERFQCWQGGFVLPDGGTPSTDCDHNAWSSTSLSYARGVFFQSTGWGAPGAVYRSTDGVTWARAEVPTTQNVMHGPTRSLLASRSSAWSDDDGVTWHTGLTIPVTSGANTIWNVRGGTWGGGVFLVFGADGANLDVLASDDDGQSWRRPTLTDGSRADVCGAGHPTFGGGVFVTLATQTDGSTTTRLACRSDDGAHTFSVHPVANEGGDASALLWTGAEFIFWTPGKVHRSPDGMTWTSQATQTRKAGVLSGGPNLGAATVTASGAFVGVRGGWNVWYDSQRFYRSTDGVIWDELPVSAYHAGHPVTGFVAGLAERSTACP